MASKRKWTEERNRSESEESYRLRMERREMIRARQEKAKVISRGGREYRLVKLEAEYKRIT